MADNPSASNASQKAGSSQHQRIVLQKQLAEVRMENTVLRQQLYQVSSLLDIAVSKLGAMGVALETPIDIRTLRSEALRRAHAEAAQAQYDATAGSSKNLNTASTHSTNKRFQMRQQLCEHTKAVQCCAFSDREEPLIATGGMDCRLIVSNHFTGEKLWDATAHEEAVSDVAWFDPHCLLSASYDSTVRLWDVNGGTESKDVLYQYSTHAFVLSAIPVGHSLFACADARLKTALVDVRAGGKSMVQDHDHRVNTLCYDEAAHQLLMGHSNGVVSIWDLRRPDQALQTSNMTGGTGSNSSIVASPPPTAASVSAQRGVGADSSAAAATAAGAVDATSVASASLKDVAAMGLPSVAGINASSTPIPIANSTATSASAGPPRLVHATEFENEPSHSPISYMAHVHNDDDTRRLICVSGDNMVRLYRGNLNAFTAGRTDGANLYVVRSVITGVPTRGTVMRSGFWKGERGGKSEVSVFFDDGEMDAVKRPVRRLTECDVLVTGGPDNTAHVYDVTDDGGAVVLERLEGHRDRVTGAAVRRSRKPIIATTSADSTVRIWVPVKI